MEESHGQSGVSSRGSASRGRGRGRGRGGQNNFRNRDNHHQNNGNRDESQGQDYEQNASNGQERSYGNRGRGRDRPNNFNHRENHHQNNGNREEFQGQDFEQNSSNGQERGYGNRGRGRDRSNNFNNRANHHQNTGDGEGIQSQDFEQNASDGQEGGYGNRGRGRRQQNNFHPRNNHHHQSNENPDEPQSEEQNSHESNRGRGGPRTVRNNVQTTRGRRNKPNFMILEGEGSRVLEILKHKDQPTKPDATPAETEEQQVEEGILCPLCFTNTPQLTGIKLYAITSCSHVFCYECALRVLYLVNNLSCPICRQDLTRVVITGRLTVDSSNLEKLMYEYTHNTKIITRYHPDDFIFMDMAQEQLLPKSMREIIEDLLDFKCKICIKRNMRKPFCLKVNFKSVEVFEQINEHLQSAHKSQICEMCYMHVDQFVPEYPIFGENELQLHRKYGTKGSLVGAHACCYLCQPEPTYYFDRYELEKHCNIAHCACYVCVKKIYFLNTAGLRTHIEQNHLLCAICADTTNETLGFATQAEYERHIEREHPNAPSDFSNQFTARNQMEIEFDEEENESEITERMANDQIDNILRQSYARNQHEFFNASNVESYITNFPSIPGVPNGEQLLPSTTKNVHVFPGKKSYVKMGGKQHYEQDFPDLGPGASTSGAPTFNISKSKFQSKAPKVDFSRPLSNVTLSDQTQQQQPTASWKGKKPKHATASSSQNERSALFDGFVENFDGSTSTGEMKPPSVAIIERQEPAPSHHNPQRAPKSEEFPSLAGPSKSKSRQAQSALSGWSKVSAAPPQVKQSNESKKKSEPNLEKKAARLNLNDGSSFPTLETRPSGSSGQGSKVGAWGVSVPTKSFNRKGKLSNNQVGNDNLGYFPPPNSTSGEGQNDGGFFFMYVPPKNDLQRVRDMNKRIRTVLTAQGKENLIPSFKQEWTRFQNDSLSAAALHQQHEKLLGEGFYDEILCDVITLTPNIAQQHVLNDHWKEVYRRKQELGRLPPGPNRNAPWECDVCAQLVIPSEKGEHSRYHSQTGLSRRK